MGSPSVSMRALFALFALLAQGGWASVSAQPSSLEARPTLLDRYCVTCHNARNKANAGSLDLTAVDPAQPARHPDVFEKVIAKLRTGLMPPAGQRQPDGNERASFVGDVERELDRAAVRAPNPGRTETFHRLNRAEYRNVIRDLLEVDIDVASLLPPDDASFGFDN